MVWVSQLRVHHRALLSALVFTTTAATLAVLAVTAQGQPPTQVNLNDGGVWVTATDLHQAGRYLPQIKQQDLPGTFVSANFDILQSGSQVLLTDAAAGTIQAVDPALVSVTGPAVKVGGQASVAMGGPSDSAVVAVVNPAGSVWVTPFDQLGGLDLAKTAPTAHAGPDAKVAVGVDGTVYVTSGHSLLTITPGATAVAQTALPGGATGSGGGLTVTAVGSIPVVLDGPNQQLLIGGQAISAPLGTDAILQQPGPASDTVLLATRSGLVQVPLSGGSPVSLGTPVQATTSPLTAPVFVNGCSFGAFVVGGQLVQVSGGAQPCAWPLRTNQVQLPSNFNSGDGLVYRVNRGLLALNDPSTGAIWDPTDPQLTQRDNWQQNTAKDQQQKQQEQSTGTKPVCVKTPTTPHAGPITVGARPGLPVVIPVLTNAYDADCDILALASVPTVDPKLGTIGLVGDGRLVQFTPDISARGSVSFGYTVTDGQGRNASSTITVQIHSGNVDSPPKLVGSLLTVVVQGKSVSYNVLGAFQDPDGDPMQLVGATAAGGQGVVSFTPDGLVTYVDNGKTVGQVRISLDVSDGRGGIGHGFLTVEVKPASSVPPPTAADDYEHTTAGVAITFNPLNNDSDPAQNPIRLASVSTSSPAGLSVQPDFQSGSITASAAKAGTYLLTYQIVAGAGQASGRIRVDVTDPPKKNSPPTAMVDIANVQVGRETSVDVLDNDVDPDGDVLAVTGVSAPAESGIVASVVDQRTVVISTSAILTMPVLMTYSETDGVNPPVQGVIVVNQIDPGLSAQPPLARPDQATVPAGGFVTIPVLANDTGGVGHRLVLASDLVIKPTMGQAYVNGDQVRYLAGTKPGTDSFTYKVVDTDAANAAATATVTVTIVSASNGSPPVPPVLEARVHVGDKVQIQVPTTGADPSGAATVLSGVLSSAAGNTVTASGNTVTYQADGPQLGTDLVTYQLCTVSPQSKCATGTIRVGVFPVNPQGNRPPVTHPYVLSARPGKRVSVDVTTFDTDPDNDPITLVTEAPHQVSTPVPMSVAGSAQGVITLTAPATPGSYAVTYWITDGKHAPVEGTITLVDNADAPQPPPIAQDDVATADQAVNGVLTIDVLANDSYPGGTIADLHPELINAPSNARVVGDKVQVKLTGRPQVLAYRAIAPDGQFGTAFILVMDQGNVLPRLKNPPMPLSVVVGKSITFDLKDEVVDPDNGPKPLRILSSSGVTAQPQSRNAGQMVNGTQITYSPVTAPATGDQGYISVQVTDGTTPVSIVIPVTVTSDAPRPLIVQPLQVTVEEGAGAPTTVDLRTSVTDPNPPGQDHLTFAKAGAPSLPGLTVTIDPQGQASVTAAVGLALQTGTQNYTVSDGHGNPITSTLTITVVKTTLPMPAAVNVPLDRLDLGKSIAYDLISKLHDPFTGRPKSGLTLVSVVDPPHSGGGDVTAVVNGSTATFTGTRSGPVSLSYTVKDVAGRQATGSISINVWGPPSTPGVPTVASGTTPGPDWVMLTWSPSTANTYLSDPNATNVTYSVSWGAGGPQSCPGNTCLIGGLKPGTPYQFTVQAHNAVGDSTPSGPSATITPDAPPAAPVFTPQPNNFGDGSVTLNWTQPSYQGSAIVNYTLTVLPADVGPFTLPAGSTAKTVTGLRNGTNYSFVLCAKNDTATPVCTTPYLQMPIAPPGQVTNLKAQPVADPAGGLINATWTAAPNGGDTGMTYTVQLLQGSTVVTTQTGITGTSVQLPATNGVAYAVRVTAINRNPTPGQPVTSDTVTPLKQPGPVTGLSANGTGVQGVIQVAFTQPSDMGGATSVTYEYNIGGGWAALTGRTISGLNNGQLYTVQVRVQNGSGFPSVAASVPLNDATAAYSAPPAPSVGVSAAGTQALTFTWNAATNGNAINVTASVDGGGAMSEPANGSIQVGNGYSQTHSIVVRTCLQAHQTVCASNSAAGTTNSPPPPPPPSQSISIGWSGAHASWIWMTLTGFSGRNTYTCNFSDGTSASYIVNVTGNPQTWDNGATCYDGFRGQRVWVTIGSVASNQLTVP